MIRASTATGETQLSFTHNGHAVFFKCLMVENLDTDVIEGITLLEANDASICPFQRDYRYQVRAYLLDSLLSGLQTHSTKGTYSMGFIPVGYIVACGFHRHRLS